MKNTNRYLAAICTGVLAIAGCQKPEIEGDGNIAGGTTVIKATLSTDSALTKTQMTPGADADTYKVEWQDGDAIRINGMGSTDITVLDNAKYAEFLFEGAVIEPPYYAVYPAGVASNYAEGSYTIDLPKTQTYAGSDKFDSSAALMFGYSDAEGGVTFSHAMAYIRLTLSGEGQPAIKSAVFESNGKEALSGTFTATCTEGVWSLEKAAEGSAYSVTLDCGSAGAAIGEKMILAVPAGTYEDGFTIVLKDKNSGYMVKKSTNSFTAEAGGIYDMSLAYVSQGTVIEGGIYNTSDWNAFAAAVKGGNTYEGKSVTLMANLTSETYFDYADGRFEGTFNGNGYKMTANGNKWPLFQTVGTNGKILNLNMYGEFASLANSGECGTATIAKVNKGLIKNCNNYSNATVSATGGLIFGMICAQNGGTLENCKNYGNLDVTYKATGASGFYGGGLAALGHTVLGGSTATYIDTDETCTPGHFINCENHGNITAAALAGKSIKCAYGGICGMVYLNGVVFDGCKNYGDVSRIGTRDGAKEESSSYTTAVGGILGRSAAWSVVVGGTATAFDNGYDDSKNKTGYGYDTQYINCYNEGTILCSCRHTFGYEYNKQVRRSDNAGGIVGLAIGAENKIQKLTGCVNKGTVQGGWDSGTNCTMLGGLAGYACFTEISDCDAICTIKSTDSNKAVGVAGGLVGYVMSDVTIKNGCISAPTMEIYGKKNSTNFSYGLVFGNIFMNAEVLSANVGGSISTGTAGTADLTALEINSGTYTGYLISANTSNAALSSPVTTWYSAN